MGYLCKNGLMNQKTNEQQINNHIGTEDNIDNNDVKNNGTITTNITTNATTSTTRCSNINNNNNNNNLRKQTSGVTSGEQNSRIPIVRTTATLLNLDMIRGSSATVPAVRSTLRMQPHHHMMLRGRSRMRHQLSNIKTDETISHRVEGCKSVTARYYRDVSVIPQNINCTNGRSSSASLDINLNVTKTCHDNNNNNDDSLSSDNSFPISDATSTNFMKDIHINNLRSITPHSSSADTNRLNYSITGGRGSLDSAITLRYHTISPLNNTNLSSNSSLDTTLSSSVNNNNNNNNNICTTPTQLLKGSVGNSGSSSSCSTTISLIKRNKRSLSSTRIEKDKSNECNKKLLRKNIPKKHDNNGNTVQTENTNTNTTTNSSNNNKINSSKNILNSVSTMTSAIPTPTNATTGIYLTRGVKYEISERQKQQQSMQLRKKISH